ncbi:MAG: 30S ribosomal protein S17 [Dehalococcoidia bacterium]
MGSQKVLQGTVASNKMDKTVVVVVERRKKHRLYHKVMTLTTRYKAHDDANACSIGDLVRIEECRPLSKEKRWRVIEVLSQGDVAEIAPETIGRETEQTVQVAPKAEQQAAEEEAEE